MSLGHGASIVRDGLVLHLDAANPKSYTSGTTWYDLSGNDNNGTLINGVGYSTDNKGAMIFDGVNDYITGSIPTLSSWSMSIWYFSTDIILKTVYYPFSCNTGTANGIGFGGNFSEFSRDRWYFFDGANVFSSLETSVVINKWYYLTVTKTGTTYNLYTNGDFSLTGTGANLSCTSYTLGRRGDGSWPVTGKVSSGSIYNKVLTPQEVQQNFEATRGRYGI